MRLYTEIRSSGEGPRAPFRHTNALDASHVGSDSRTMALRWTRLAVDHKGRTKRLCDGVAIIIRRAG